MKVESLTIEHMEALSKCHVFVKIRKLIDDATFTFIKIINLIEFHLWRNRAAATAALQLQLYMIGGWLPAQSSLEKGQVTLVKIASLLLWTWFRI